MRHGRRLHGTYVASEQALVLGFKSPKPDIGVEEGNVIAIRNILDVEENAFVPSQVPTVQFVSRSTYLILL